MSRTMCIAKRSRAPAPGAWPRSMQRSISMPSLPEDEELRRALAGVQPLREPRRLHLRPAQPAPFPRQTHLDEQAALDESLHAPFSPDDALETGEELVFLREGLSRQVLRKLRRGHWVIQDGLDLHGMNRVEAARCVSEFLRR